PTAQDFHAAFGLGHDERSIGTVDADGVALAAAQALTVRTDDLRETVTSLQGQNAELRDRVTTLEGQNAALEARLRRVEEMLAAQAAPPQR
ncbi:MAG TPA: hypothetical protein VFR37_13230, partial [Longimicrobium sp.]|nr:hypothetical protein [Longimicrobium sp.]